MSDNNHNTKYMDSMILTFSMVTNSQSNNSRFIICPYDSREHVIPKTDIPNLM